MIIIVLDAITPQDFVTIYYVLQNFIQSMAYRILLSFWTKSHISYERTYVKVPIRIRRAIVQYEKRSILLLPLCTRFIYRLRVFPKFNKFTCHLYSWLVVRFCKDLSLFVASARSANFVCGSRRVFAKAFPPDVSGIWARVRCVTSFAYLRADLERCLFEDSDSGARRASRVKHWHSGKDEGVRRDGPARHDACIKAAYGLSKIKVFGTVTLAALQL